MIAPLYGGLPGKSQDLAIAPAAVGKRKIVLSTSIAETSLTIEGIRIVIDSGLMRVSRYDVGSGMARLITIPVNRDTAAQRRGRAGRLEPGICYRLWSEEHHRMLPAHGSPEILNTDLTPLALELAAWGIPDPTGLSWLDPPPPAAFNQARMLLTRLGALDNPGRITGHGRQLSGLGASSATGAHDPAREMPLAWGTLPANWPLCLKKRTFCFCRRVSGMRTCAFGWLNCVP